MIKSLLLLFVLSPMSVLHAQNHAIIVSSAGVFANVDNTGRLYVNTTISAPSYFGYDTGLISIGTKDLNQPAMLLINESTNTVQAALQEMKVAMVTSNAYTIIRGWVSPVVVSSGTAITPAILAGTTPAKLKLYTLPTASGTTVVDSYYIGLNSNMVTLSIGGSIVLRPGDKFLITGYSGTVSTEYIFNIKWTEELYTP